MVRYKQRHGLAQLAAVLGLLLGGGAGGAALGWAVAPDSGASVFVSGAMLPVGAFLGVSLWLGVAVAFVVLQFARGRRGSDKSAAVRERFTPPPGSAAFLPSSVGSCVAAACLVSALSTEASLLGIFGPYVVVGATYGLVAWWLARAGYFPAPDGS